MAIFPCSVLGHHYEGKQRTVYPAVLYASDAERKKWRLCGTHFDLLMIWARAYMHSPEDGVDEQRCAQCGDKQPTFPVFLTVYDLGAEREDFFASLCGKDANTLLTWAQSQS